MQKITPCKLLSIAAVGWLAACTEVEQPTESAPAEGAPDVEAAASLGDAVARLTAGMDAHAIYVVGNDYSVGAGVDKDQALAEMLWRTACDKGHTFACENYGSRRIEAGEYDLAAQYLLPAAEADSVGAIRNLIELYGNSSWEGASFQQQLRWQDRLQQLEELGDVDSPPASEPAD